MIKIFAQDDMQIVFITKSIPPFFQLTSSIFISGSIIQEWVYGNSIMEVGIS
ncbi:MAG: hypothetical protein HYV28_17820 [Ignavibacteriales bacterium]|nr:hypothetical protein [Ignavibacteriales bacterium]